MGQPRHASHEFAQWFGWTLIIVGVLIPWKLPHQWIHNLHLPVTPQGLISTVSCFIFGWVLIRWSRNSPEPKVPIAGVQDEKYKEELAAFHRGIGNDTITMVVAVVTGVITIFTLVHIADNSGKITCTRPSVSSDVFTCVPDD